MCSTSNILLRYQSCPYILLSLEALRNQDANIFKEIYCDYRDVLRTNTFIYKDKNCYFSFEEKPVTFEEYYIKYCSSILKNEKTIQIASMSKDALGIIYLDCKLVSAMDDLRNDLINGLYIDGNSIRTRFRQPLSNQMYIVTFHTVKNLSDAKDYILNTNFYEENYKQHSLQKTYSLL